MSTEKYMAGFLDADGYVGIRSRLGARPDCEFSISQRALYQDVIKCFTREFGGCFRIRKISEGEYAEASFRGGDAVKIFERLAKYAVIKGPFMRAAICLVRNTGVLKTAEDVREFRRSWKELKRNSRGSVKNYPPRKWLAGYFDGDGSFTTKTCYKTGYAYPHASILAAPHYSVGIELLAKVFGGKLCMLSTGNMLWQLSLSQPSKIKEFVGFFADNLIIKKAQAYYLLGLATGGNLRDGETIKQHMQVLNSQQHRLSDPASYAADLIREVRFDLPNKWEINRRNRLEATVETPTKLAA